jgi:hypothetical protein
VKFNKEICAANVRGADYTRLARHGEARKKKRLNDRDQRPRTGEGLEMTRVDVATPGSAEDLAMGVDGR